MFSPFTSHLTSKLSCFYSWRPDLLAEATDAFLQDWRGPVWLCQPIWNRLWRVLAKVEDQAVGLILVTPQPISCRAIRDHSSGKLSMGGSGRVPSGIPPTTSHVPRLRRHYTNQNLSRETSDLLFSSWRQKLPQFMTHCAKDGLAGVLNINVIPFQDL